MQAASQPTEWFVMRDLTRPNALHPAYKRLEPLGFEVFTPMRTKISVLRGKHIKRDIPYIHDLLFVNARRSDLDKVVDEIPTLQYRFLKGAGFGAVMKVSDAEMQRFIAGIRRDAQPRYYRPGEITPQMYGRKVRMICPGPLNGYEGRLLKLRGTTRKRLILELPGLLSAAVEVAAPDYLELL